jgi:hypothetical protein
MIRGGGAALKNGGNGTTSNTTRAQAPLNGAKASITANVPGRHAHQRLIAVLNMGVAVWGLKPHSEGGAAGWIAALT